MIERPKDPVGPPLNDVGFTDHIYVQAAAIFQNGHVEKPADQKLVDYGRKGNLWMPEERDEESCLLAYELAFNSLKYQDLLESVITSCTVICYSVPEDLMSLVVVMLFDFQDRKFVNRRRLKGERLPDVITVEACLFRYKTKLAASLARIRIKFNLLNIECVLPEIVKERQKMARSLLLYAWVNTQKTSLEDVKDALTREGFSEAGSVQQLQGQAFCRDAHCEDLLVFAPRHKEQLSGTELVKDCKLVIQDKSCSLPVSAVRSVLDRDRGVLVTGCFSALTVAHTAAAAAASRSGNVLVCEGSGARRKELRAVLSKMACSRSTCSELVPLMTAAAFQEVPLKHCHCSAASGVCCYLLNIGATHQSIGGGSQCNCSKFCDLATHDLSADVEIIPSNFMDLDPMGVELEGVSVILMMPQCSLSAVSNPVDFIVRENRDIDLLQDLSRGSISPGRLNNLAANQKRELEHAMKVPKSEAVVYSTWSSCSEENEEVVEMVVRSKPRIYRLSATGLPPGSKDKPEGNKDLFVLEASAESNGGFVSVMTRTSTPAMQQVAVAEPRAVKKDAKMEESTTAPEIPWTAIAAPSSNKAPSKKPSPESAAGGTDRGGGEEEKKKKKKRNPRSPTRLAVCQGAGRPHFPRAESREEMHLRGTATCLSAFAL
ncbi:putative methyltransferase NSUN7 [Anguilla rostrata]|uniref:putative methyltransferase NSUN7 n=1 Tax=Anguilla rostrata TaxID=7938 RepID=UPI0030CF4B11